MVSTRFIAPLAFSCSCFLLNACKKSESNPSSVAEIHAARSVLGQTLNLSLVNDAGLSQSQADYIVQKGYSQASLGLHKSLALTSEDSFKSELKEMTLGVFAALDDAEAGIAAENMAKVIQIMGRTLADKIDEAATASELTLDGIAISSIVSSLSQEALSELSNDEASKYVASLSSGFMEGALKSGQIPQSSFEVFAEGMMAALVAELGSRSDLQADTMATIIGESSEGVMAGAGLAVEVAQLEALFKAINEAAMSSAGKIASFDVTELQALAEACSKATMEASAALANFDKAYYDDLASAATAGLLAGAGAIAGFDQAYFDELAKAATAGLMEGAGAIAGLESAMFASIAEAGARGVMDGAASLPNFDSAFYDELAKASSEGLMVGASELEDFDPSLYADLAKAATAGLIAGAGDIEGLAASLFKVIAEAGAAGVMVGAGEINAIPASLYDELAKASSEGAVDGAAEIEGFDPNLIKELAEGASAGVMTGAGEIPGFDPSLFDELAGAAAQGAVTGAGSFEGLNDALLDAISDAASAGAVDAAPEGVSKEAIEAAAETGATIGESAAQELYDCYLAGGMWTNGSCVIPPAEPTVASALSLR